MTLSAQEMVHAGAGFLREHPRAPHLDVYDHLTTLGEVEIDRGDWIERGYAEEARTLAVDETKGATSTARNKTEAEIVREKNALVKFRDWARKKIDGSASFNVPELVKEAEAVFGGDAKFLTAFAGATIRDRMAIEIRRLAIEGRESIAQVGKDAFVTASRLQEAADGVALGVWGRWQDCYEHVGEQYLSVLDMRDKDLVEAEAARNGLSEAHLKWARFFHALRPQMKRGKTVRDCFSAEKLDRLWEKHSTANQQEVA